MWLASASAVARAGEQARRRGRGEAASSRRGVWREDLHPLYCLSAPAYPLASAFGQARLDECAHSRLRPDGTTAGALSSAPLCRRSRAAPRSETSALSTPARVGAQARDRPPRRRRARRVALAARRSVPGRISSAHTRTCSAVDPQRVEREREAAQEGLRTCACGVAADPGAVEAGRALIFDRARRSGCSRARRGRGRSGTASRRARRPATHRRCRAREIHSACSRAGTPPGAGGALSQLSSVTHTGLRAGRQRGAVALGLPQQARDLRGVGDRDVQRGRRRQIRIADRQRVEGEHVEVRRFRAALRSRCARASPAQQLLPQERHRRHPPDAGRVAVGSHAGGDHRVGRLAPTSTPV